MLNKTQFTPDETHVAFFPWEDVMACFNKPLKSKNDRGQRKCPKCSKDADALEWIMFRSPDWTWEELCGRQGPLSICPDCCIQVEFITHRMN